MKRITLIILAALCPLWIMAVSVKDFGARGDGRTLNTRSIQQAIDQLSGEGGGQLDFPAGRYLTGTVRLKDNVSLHLMSGATLLASTDLKDYPEIEAGYVSHVNRYTNRFLIYAENARNIAITGEGTIDGQGSDPHFRADTARALLDIRRRPYIVRMISCDNVRLSGIALRNSPSWMQHYLHCSNLRLENLRIFNHGNYNNDGIDVDNCTNVLIAGCNIDTDDDGICFKSTNSADTCRNIVVANCIVASNCNALKIGTETNGGFRNIVVSSCTFHRPGRGTIYPRRERALGGIALSTADGASIDGVCITNITMDGVMTPVFLHLANRGRNFRDGGPSQPPGTLRNIQIANVFARTEGHVASSITGLPEHPVENVTLSNIHIVIPGGGSADDARRRNIPEREREYPETLKFSDVPACGFFIRHASGITLDNVRIEALAPDPRDALYVDDVQQLDRTGFSFSCPHREAAFSVRRIRVLLAGDSTMQDTNHDKNADWGWGQVFPRFFGDSVAIRNFAKGGRSTRTFIEEGLWDKLLAEADTGDCVFIQFGHNDASQKKPDRYTPPEQYRANLLRFVREARERGACPVLLTPVTHRKFKGGTPVANTHGPYPDIVRQVASETGAPFIDLQAMSVRLLALYGDTASRALYIHIAPGQSALFPEGKTDDTHFSEQGAMQIAGLVAESIRRQKLNPLDRFLK
jgi:lysophospholipase L1-like esterase